MLDAIPERPEVGMLAFTFGHKHRHWITNDLAYSFGPFTDEAEGIEVTLTKSRPGSLHIHFTGKAVLIEHDHDISDIKPVKPGPGSQTDQTVLTFQAAWSPGSVDVYLGGLRPPQLAVSHPIA